MFSNYGEFYYIGRAIINLIQLYFIDSAFACTHYFVYFVKVEYCFYHFFFFFENSKLLYNRSTQSPKFENLLLDDNLCRVFEGGAACWNQTAIVTIGYVIMSVIIANSVLM